MSESYIKLNTSVSLSSTLLMVDFYIRLFLADLYVILCICGWHWACFHWTTNWRLLPASVESHIVWLCHLCLSRFDESLWRRLDLATKNLKRGVLGRILERGVAILRLARSTVILFLKPDTYLYVKIIGYMIL